MIDKNWRALVLGGAFGATSVALAQIAFNRFRSYGKLAYGISNISAEITPTVGEGVPGVPSVDRVALDRETACSDEILAEQLTRNVQFFGTEAQRQIAGSFVVVVGLGGVGSHAAHLLLRSGVGKLRLIDFDQVTLSSLNRHAVATRSDVGLPKATCLERHFRRICPEAELDPRVEMFDADTEEAHLGGGPDFVLDAIDNIDTKVALLAACHRRGIPVLCVGGAGARLDPTRLRFADISETSVDPLARSVRSRLRKDHGIKSGVTVLLSVEKPTCKLLPIDQVAAPGQDPLDFQVVPNFRVRTIPVLGTLPAMFGMAAATFLLARLAGRDLDPDSPVSLTRAQYERQLTRLEDRERERFGSDDGVAVDIDEIVYLVRELWRGFSARAPRVVLPGGDKGLCRSTSELVLTRWDSRRPATVDNLVLLTREEADTHDSTDLETIRSAEPEFYRDVSLSLQRARHDFCCRHDQCLLQESSCAPLATA